MKYIVDILGTAEDFLQPDADGKSPYTIFIDRMAAALGTSTDYVDVFSVIDSEEEGYVDVRYTAHGSPYYNTTKLIGAVLDDADVSTIIHIFKWTIWYKYIVWYKYI